MRKLLLLATWLTLAAALTAQITVTNAVFPQAGDTLYTAVDGAPTGVSVGTTGGAQQWDFSQLSSPFVSADVVLEASQGQSSALFPDADLVLDYLGGEGYARVTADAVEVVGFAGDDPFGQGLAIVVNLDPTATAYRAPISFGDTYVDTSYFRLLFDADDLPLDNIGLPLTPDSIRISVTTIISSTADAYGTATIPMGTYDVLRIRSEQQQDVLIEAKVGFLPWADVTSIFLANLPDIDLLSPGDTVVSYRYQSNVAKEPIAVITVDDNDQPTEAEYRTTPDAVTSVRYQDVAGADVSAYPNPTFDNNVKLQFSGLPTGEYTVKMYNLIGKQVWAKQYYISGDTTHALSLSGFAQGTYLYTVEDQRGRKITTRRLMVLRP